ncbi:MAG: DNA polymerase III subunit chi [Desulfuromonadales bacterium]|nr:DNA polymerase III subunit chi [Desulfuromonadales bacterium]MBN2792397.1 DNA polymerase III subunit chi [Desulfuromonadales bacterium]
MIVTQVKFVKLDKQEKLSEICRLAEYFYQQNSRVMVFVADENQAISLDRFLWARDRGSFLPHAFDNGSVECFDEPIVIACEENNSNNASVLILGSPCSVSFISGFNQAIDFAELSDPELAELSRERFRQYRQQGLNPQMF